MSKSTLKIKKESSGEDIKRRLKFLVNNKILVGVQGTQISREDEELTSVDVALQNEFGTEKIPERSFIRASVAYNAEKYKKYNQITYKNILNGKLIDVTTRINGLGIIARDDMKKYAVDLRMPENSEITIEKKGSDNPLVDTSQMINSITYVIENDT